MSTDGASRADDRRAAYTLVFALIAAMWVVEVIDQIDHHRLERFGIEPHHAEGLRGILFAPFLHAGWDHLIGNTIPFVMLGLVIALNGVARVAAVTAIVMVIGGLGTWVFAPANSLHIGASGVVFGYAAYLISRGIFNESLLELVIGAVVVVIWGTVLLGGLEPHQGISWQGHLFGAIGGVVAARVLRRDGDGGRQPTTA